MVTMTARHGPNTAAATPQHDDRQVTPPAVADTAGVPGTDSGAPRVPQADDSTGQPDIGTSGDSTYTTVVPQTLGHLRLLTVGPVEFGLDGMVVRISGRIVHMAPKEFDLFATLLNNAGKVLTRRQLLDAVWGEGYPDNNKSLDVHILRLRRHLKPFPAAYAGMRTVRSIGYVFDIEP